MVCKSGCARARAKWTDITQGAKEPSFDADLSAIDLYAQRVYAEQIAAFRPAVAATDPRGVFQNSWLAQVFGLGGAG